MRNFIQEIVPVIQERISHRKEILPESELKEKLTRRGGVYPHPFALRDFKRAIEGKEKIALIAEIKQASPSAGKIREEFSPPDLAKEYEKGGASAVSVLTEEKYFGGDIYHLLEAHRVSSLPLLRKDFIVDPYQILESRVFGADTILLIVRILKEETLKNLIGICRDLGMEPLVEVHTEKGLEIALRTGAKMIGINNRDLETLKVDIETVFKLAEKVPHDKILVVESGISKREVIERLKKIGVDAVLIGEYLLKADDKEAAIRELGLW